MLENPQLLRKTVKETGAHQTNQESPEDVDHLCAKCDDYAKGGSGSRRDLSEESTKRPSYENPA